MNSFTSIRNIDGTWAIKNIQEAKRFAEHLENTFQPNKEEVSSTYVEGSKSHYDQQTR